MRGAPFNRYDVLLILGMLGLRALEVHEETHDDGTTCVYGVLEDGTEFLASAFPKEDEDAIMALAFRGPDPLEARSIAELN